MLPQIDQFWPGAGKVHIDSWQEVTAVDGFSIQVVPKREAGKEIENKLFFLNLGDLNNLFPFFFYIPFQS